MPSNTTTYNFFLPTVGGDTNLWGGYLNSNWEDVEDLLDGTEVVDGIDIDGGSIDGTPIGATNPSTGVFTTLETTGGGTITTSQITISSANPIVSLADTDANGMARFRQTNGIAWFDIDPGNVDADSKFNFFFDGSKFVTIDRFGHMRLGDNSDPTVTLELAGTDAILVPVGTTAQRPTGANGLLRYNSTNDNFEGYADGAWGPLGGGAGRFKGENGTQDQGSGAGDIFRVNEQELNTDVTIDADENASCTGPLTVASGVTLTVTSGGNLAIV